MVGLKADLRPQRSADLAGAAPRPRNSALEPGRLAALGQAPPPWQDGLRRYLVAKGHLTG
jgi:dTDP-4-dehydrorhamnose reductase